MIESERRLKAYELGLLRFAAMPDSMKRSLMAKEEGPEDKALHDAIERLIAEADRRITTFLDDSRHRRRRK